MSEGNQVTITGGGREVSAEASHNQEGDAMLSMIERVCTDSNFDIAKMEKIIAMRDNDIARKARQQYASDFVAMQEDLPVIPKNKKVKYGNTQYDFADLAQVTKFLRPIARKHGFGWSHGRNGDVIVTTLIHKDGHTSETERTVNPDNSGSKNAAQADGSASSYCKRYNLLDLFGIATEDEDNDAQTIHMDSEELALIKSSISNAATIEVLNKAKQVATDNKIRMSKAQKLEIAAEVERVRKEITQCK